MRPSAAAFALVLLATCAARAEDDATRARMDALERRNEELALHNQDMAQRLEELEQRDRERVASENAKLNDFGNLSEWAKRIRISGSANAGYYHGGTDTPFDDVNFQIWDLRFFLDADLGRPITLGDTEIARNAGFSFEWNLVRLGELQDGEFPPGQVGETYIELQGLGGSRWFNTQLGRFQIPVGEAYLRYGKGYADKPVHLEHLRSLVVGRGHQALRLGRRRPLRLRGVDLRRRNGFLHRRQPRSAVHAEALRAPDGLVLCERQRALSGTRRFAEGRRAGIGGPLARRNLGDAGRLVRAVDPGVPGRCRHQRRPVGRARLDHADRRRPDLHPRDLRPSLARLRLLRDQCRRLLGLRPRPDVLDRRMGVPGRRHLARAGAASISACAPTGSAPTTTARATCSTTARPGRSATTSRRSTSIRSCSAGT